MAIVFDDNSLSRGISEGAGALAGALEKRAEKRLMAKQQEQEKQQKQEKLGSLEAVLQNADMSSDQGTRAFIGDYLRADGEIKDALAIVKQSHPSSLNRILSNFGYGEGAGQGAPVQRDGNVQQGTPIQQGGPVQQGGPSQPLQQGGPVQKGGDQHPATKHLPFNELPDHIVTALTASDNPADRDFAKAVTDSRLNARKFFNEDRKYAFTVSKKYMEGLSEQRETTEATKRLMGEMQWGLENRSLGQELSDWAFSLMGGVGERFVSPEGVLIMSSAKHFFIEDLAEVKGKPNEFVEKQILNALPSLGKSKDANDAVLSGMRRKIERNEAKSDATDRLLSEARGDPYVMENIERLTHKAVKKDYIDIDNDHSYRLREIQERSGNLGKLSKNKVVNGTPLTLEMMTFMADEVGLDTAIKNAKKLGYRVPDAEEYGRHQ